MVLMEALVHQRKSLVLTLVKQTPYFAWVCIIMVIIVNCYGKEIFKFNKNVNFSTQFCLESISNGSGTSEFRQVSIKENMYVFSVDYNALDKFDILNIHKYLVVKNSMK